MTYLRQIRSFNKDHKIKIAVIDDDPTGCQTVHSVPLLTSWDISTLEEALENNDVIFILTNSRSLKAEEAGLINREVASNLKAAVSERWDHRIISRSDSTLRGHFKEEVDALIETTGPYDGIIIVPFFAEGNRVTCNDIHYIIQDGKFFPVAETEFARDPVFGFPVSNLTEWLEFKTHGKWLKDDAVSVSLEDIRKNGPEGIAQKLIKVTSARPVIINALNYEDLECAVWGLCLAEQQGKKFLYRSAASFVRIRAGINRKQLLSFSQSEKSANALIIAGSYTQKTTRQIEELSRNTRLLKADILLNRIFTDSKVYENELINLVDQGLASGQNVLLITERKLVDFGSDDENQTRAREISLFISRIISGLGSYPGVIISKGGITSHDVMKHGLGIQQAEVLGQIEPGVPLLKISSGDKSSGFYYIIFPGNVGEPESLSNIIERLCFI